VQQFARGGGVVAVLVAVTRVADGLVALVLVRPRGRVIPRGWLLIVSAGTSVLLVVYGGLNVTAGALVLSGVIHPAGGGPDRTALACWGLGSVVPGVGDLAGAGNRGLLAADGKPEHLNSRKPGADPGQTVHHGHYSILGAARGVASAFAGQ
jgi:hypothetical protein